MSQALDFIVQTGLKVERYFCCISQLSTVILVLDFCIAFFQIAAVFNLQLFLLKQWCVSNGIVISDNWRKLIKGFCS